MRPFARERGGALEWSDRAARLVHRVPCLKQSARRFVIGSEHDTRFSASCGDGGSPVPPHWMWRGGVCRPRTSGLSPGWERRASARFCRSTGNAARDAAAAQLFQRGVTAAATVEEAVRFIHDTSKRSQLRPPAGDAHQGPSLGGSENMLHEEITMLKQVPDLAFDPLGLSGRLAGGGRRRTPAAKLGPRGGQLPADLGTRVQDGFRQLLDDMELAELVGNLAEHPGNRLWIELRAVGRDAPQQQAAPLNRRLEGAEEPLDVGMVRVVVQHLIGEAAKGVVVHDRENAKRPVVQLVGRDVSREIIQRGVQVIAADALLRLFSPRTPPSSESWRMAQRRDGPARDANWPRGRATRLPPPDAPPWQRHGGCSGSWAEPSPTCPR